MELFVTPQWVHDHLTDDSLLLLDATLPPVGVEPKIDTFARYRAAHIPGAVFFDIEALSDASSGLPHTMPSAAGFARAMSALGVGDGMTLVVYEQEGVFSAPRAMWMLRTFGAPDVRLLTGGLAAWIAAGFPTETGEVQRPARTFHAATQPGAITTFAELQRKIEVGEQVLDARSAGRFDGTAPEPRRGLASGHMPGATSVPYTDLVSNGALKSPDELREIFARKSVDLSRPITTTCGSGVTAAVVSLALEMAGGRHLSLYDGSWAEYAQRPEAVIQTTAAQDAIHR